MSVALRWSFYLHAMLSVSALCKGTSFSSKLTAVIRVECIVPAIFRSLGLVLLLHDCMTLSAACEYKLILIK